MAVKIVPYLVTISLVGLGSFYGIWAFQKSLIGEPPTDVFVPASHGEKVAYRDPDIEKLRDATKIRPKDRVVWLSLARELVSKANEGILDRQSATLEAIDALRSALDLNEKDAEALVLMGDLAFEMQAFPKALEFYGKYLDERPDDDSTRARLASTLTFLGRADEAKGILEGIVARNPNAFQARAFLALAFAQLGDMEQVRAQGAKAIELAPNEEARLRLTQFLKSFEEKAQQGDDPGVLQKEASQPRGEDGAVKLGSFLSKNPVAGPKIRDFKVDGETFIIYVEEFPMSAMPPFAKAKFFGGIKKFVQDNEITDISKIEFRDLVSAKLEGELEL